MTQQDRRSGGLGEYLQEQAGEEGLGAVILDLATAARAIADKVNRAGLTDILGETGTTNVHGEEVKKLDVVANDLIVETLKHGGSACGMASEECEELIAPSPAGRSSSYVVLFDPLDGSSNIDVNVTIGTIFSIYRRLSDSGEATRTDFLRPGSEQVAAGYFAYGSSTMLIYTAGSGVDGFTLDPSSGEFLLSHPAIRTPERGKIYSCNEGNFSTWDEGTRRYVESVRTPGAEGKPYSSRYVGSFVADVHRNLLKGGIFLYPASRKSPDKAPVGKLRLMYEANPMAMVYEQAGGEATDGSSRILDIRPTDIHQRVVVVIGSRQDVADFRDFQGA